MRLFALALCALGLGGLWLAGIDADAQTTETAAAWPDPNIEDGRRKARQCVTCHGSDGVAKIPIAPHIGGEPAAYLIAQLGAFRGGDREHEMMSVVTKTLSDQDIADLAAYYAALTPLAAPPTGRAEDGAPAQCVACHGSDGIALVEGAPHLAGESVIYIVTQLKAFRLGERENPLMTPVAAELTDEEMRDAAEWYAAIGFSTEKAQ